MKDFVAKFIWAIKQVYFKSFSFCGRATRWEYWGFFLFAYIVSTISSILDHSLRLSGDFPFFVTVSWALYVTPSISVTVRRFHDTGRSAWNTLLFAPLMLWYYFYKNMLFILLIGIILTIIGTVFTALKSSPVSNKYGEPVQPPF